MDTRKDAITATEGLNLTVHAGAHDAAVMSGKAEYLKAIVEQNGGDASQIPSAVIDALSDHLAIWKTHIKLEVYEGDVSDEDKLSGIVQPIQVIEQDTNLLLYGGASCLWQCLIGNGTGTAAQTLTYFNNGNAYIGVGDSTTAAAATQTDLQASTNKLRKAMDASNPVHTDATTSGAATIQFKSTFATSDANYAWEEWCIFNGSSGGRALNRKVATLLTKTSAVSVVFTVTVTLA